MTCEVTLEASFSGSDLKEIAQGLVVAGLCHSSEINMLSKSVVRMKVPHYVLDVTSLLERLSAVPFHLAAFRSIYPEWLVPQSPSAPPVYGFADRHFFHGWACAFRGNGHERLVSRRWLPFGPWCLHEGLNDTSLVQFHDLGANPDTARAQCVVAHPRMGGSENGGFIQSYPPLPERAPGDYIPNLRRLRVPVYGRNLTQLEMLNARTMVKLQVLGPDMPLENVTFVFADEAEGRAHLHELWLRELECVTFVDGVETDLGKNYHPQPTPPDWAR